MSATFSENIENLKHTPLPVIANITRIVTKTADRLCGDRSDYPLLVAAGCVAALKNHGIESRIMYGKAAWIEILDNHSIQWAGCWGESFTFWVGTAFGETIDLNVSVAYKKRAHSSPERKPIYSSPMLWSVDVPKFYVYEPEGVAELELFDEKDKKRHEALIAEINEKCIPSKISEDEEFPNEVILGPNRKILDDAKGTFKLFDRSLSVTGIPPLPPNF